jgi:hypothetical protein
MQVNDMATIIPFPVRRIEQPSQRGDERLDEIEVAIQLWEMVMAGERDSEAYRKLKHDFDRRFPMASALVG